MEKKIYKLTYPQKNIWLSEKYSESTAINNIAGTIHIKDFDINICKQAINKYISINDGMRLHIVIEENTPKQYVNEFQNYDIDVFDFTNKSIKEAKEFEQKISRENIKVEENTDLFYFMIVKYNDGTGTIYAKLHHLIADAWTISLLVTEISEIYDNIKYNEELHLEEIKPSYTDYITSEEEYINSEKITKDEEFWKEYLNNCKSPVDIKSKNIKTTLNAKRYTKFLDEEFNNNIKEFCKANKISEYVLFLTTFAIYINKIKDENDFILGTPVLNRSNFKEKQMTGMFVSTIPMRFKIDKEQTFIEMASSIARDNMSIFRHQKYPYSKTLEHVHNTTDIKENLYNIVFSYQNARAKLNELKGEYHANWNFSGYQQESLAFHVMDINNDGILQLNYDYLSNLFDEKEIEYLHERLMNIIKNIINNENKKIKDIEIMSKGEKELILHVFNNTKMKYNINKTIIEVFNNVLEKKKEDIALNFKNKNLTYEELDNKSNQIANYLKSSNIEEEDVVALKLSRNENMIIAILGVLKTGAAYLPIEIDAPEDRAQYMLKDSNSKLILDDGIIEKILLTFDETSNLNIKLKPEAIAYIIYTSGTTGNPKGVKITNKNVINLLYAIDEIKKLSECNVALSISKYTFDMFVIENIIPLLLGIKLIILNNEDSIMPNKIAEAIENNKAEILFITPSKLELILQDIEYAKKISSLKKITVAGEVFKENSFVKLKEYAKNTDIYNGYGPTEATVCSNVKHITSVKHINIGKPIGNTTSYIMSSSNKLLPIMVEGELCIGGEGLCDGYLNKPILNKDKFIYKDGNRLYKTGDICRFNFAGDLEYIGRIDNQVKVNGQRIELEEIDTVIKEIDGVLNSITLKENNTLVTFICTNDKIKLENDINKILKSKLPRYMIPNRIIYVDKMYINTSGKIDKKLLKEIYLKEQENKQIILPENKTEQIVYDIIKDDVKVDNISVRDSIFDIGIDSLKAINICLKLNKEFNTSLTVTDFYNNSTIKEIAKLIEKNKKNKQTEKNNQDRNINYSYKLTNNQKRLFAAYNSNTESLVYNAPCEIKLNKDIDIEKLENAINKVIKEEQVFNLKIDIIKSEAVFIEQKNNVNVKYRELPETSYKRIKKEFVKQFDLLADYLFRIYLYKTENNVYILCDFHHIIFDGTSLFILLDKIEKCYNNFNIENSNFKDYLIDKETEIFTKDADNFFSKMFESDIPKTSIITDYPREAKMTFKGSKIEKEIDSNLAIKIKEFCKKTRITENTIFMSAFLITLAKHTYQDNVIIGTAVSDRRKQEFENTIGMFVNTLPFVNCINNEVKVYDYLYSNFKDILKTVEYSSYPIDNLINSMHLSKDKSRNNIFDIMYVYQNTGIEDIKIANQNAQINPVIDNISKFDLTLEIVPKAQKYLLNIEYNINLYKQIRIETLLNNIITCIKSLVKSDINTKLSEIKIISEEEEIKTINEYNNTSYNIVKKPVNKIIEEVAEKYGNKTAIVFEDDKLSYSDLNKKANKVANMLKENGIKKDSVVAVMLDKSIELLIGILGILKAGATYLPIDLSAPKTRIEYILEDCKCKYALINSQTNVTINNIVNIDISLHKLYGTTYSENIKNINKEDDIAYIMYTSGSTGNPKGVMIPHKAINRLILHNNFVKLTSTDRVLLTGSVAFDATTFEYYSALYNGLPLYILPKEKLLNPIYLKNYINSNFITTIWLTASLFNQMAEYDPTMFFNIKNLLVGGDVLSAKHIYKVKENCPNTNIINGYGPTENTTFTTCFLIDKKYNNIPIGKPITNTTTYIVDKSNKLCPIYVPGELYVGGMGISKGYINNEQLTKEKFIFNYITGKDKLYKTGDICYFDENGVVNYIERVDNQVKINGFRIEIGEIKNKILEYIGIKDAYIIIDEINGKKYIIAYYACYKKIIADDLKSFLKSNLPGYMQPKTLIEVKDFPLNQNGKIDKNKLPKPKLKDDIIKLPRTETEVKIYNIFKEVLDLENFSITDDFFDIGGDSLMVNQIVIKAITYNIKLTYSDIFNNPTVEKLSYYLDNKEKLEDEEKLEEKYILKMMTEENYQKYDDILNYQNTKIKYINNNINNVLLTGATGFLGAHIIEQIILNTNANIYCVVRDKANKSADKRIEETLRFFFKDKYLQYLNKRIFVLNINLVGEDVNDTFESYKEIIKKIDLCIHSAAIVKHYGKLKPFIDINMIATKNIALMCKKYKIKLAYISTLSISGNVIEGGNEEQTISTLTDFSEKNLYIGQNLTNVYARTKFEGEKIILDEILNGLEACLIRVGNLTGRLSDGKFQPNVEENAFSNRLKSMIEIGVIPDNLMKFYVEFTPIDSTAQAIIKLLTRTNFNKRIFHLFNDNHVDMESFLKSISNLNIVINRISNMEFSELITKIANDNKSNLLNGIIGDLNKEKQLNYISNIIVKEDITKNILDEINFKWPIINEKYILKYIEYLNDIGFIKLNNIEKKEDM